MVPEQSRHPDVRPESAVLVTHIVLPTTSNSSICRQHVRACTRALPQGHCSTVVIHSWTIKRYPYLPHATRVTIVARHPAPQSRHDNRCTQQQFTDSKHEELSIVRNEKTAGRNVYAKFDDQQSQGLAYTCSKYNSNRHITTENADMLRISYVVEPSQPGMLGINKTGSLLQS